MTRRRVAIHGHFYQPPRENPWLEEIDPQPSAAPYRDWNERVTAECYAPNAFARILDREGRVARIISNYARISFNFGPTLLAWLERRLPDLYAAILAADKESRERFSGHGSALAQAYNHAILPLANERDKRTQLRWGIRDFESRFARRPEGLWLPETAVDTATLECLADEGIAFTVLAPRQARRARPIGAAAWRETGGGEIDGRRPYRVSLPSGRSLAVFFYDGAIAQAVAFGDLLTSGVAFAERLKSAFAGGEPGALVHVAVDGETFGHHHKFGEMALAHALELLESSPGLRLTNYGEHLERNPPTHEAEIVEASSWSCAHGVERWRADCGCSSGRLPGSRQAWRKPLREALDGLRDAAALFFESRAAGLLRDPWAARDDYIELLLDRSPARREAFLARHAARPLAEAEKVLASRLLELQRQAQLMYTSCAWFFDDLSGIETVQVLRYALRCLELAEAAGAAGLERPFLEALALARVNAPGGPDGRALFESEARPAAVSLEQIGARHGLLALTAELPAERRIGPYHLRRENERALAADSRRLAVGLVAIGSEITGEASQVCYAYLGESGREPRGGARIFPGRKVYEAMVWELTNAFSTKEFAALERMLERHFPAAEKPLINDNA